MTLLFILILSWVSGVFFWLTPKGAYN